MGHIFSNESLRFFSQLKVPFLIDSYCKKNKEFKYNSLCSASLGCPGALPIQSGPVCFMEESLADDIVERGKRCTTDNTSQLASKRSDTSRDIFVDFLQD